MKMLVIIFFRKIKNGIFVFKENDYYGHYNYYLFLLISSV